MNLALAQTLFVIALVGIAPFLDLSWVRSLQRSSTPQARVRTYQRLIAGLWITAALSAALLRGQHLFSLPQQVISTPWLHSGAFRTATVVSASVAFTLILFGGLQCFLKPGAAAFYTRALARLSYLLPATHTERLWFAALSLSAGFCEELIFRGFLLRYLVGDLAIHHGIGLLGAILASSLVFGLNHLYQGRSEILKTGFVGLSLACVAALTGGLALPILLHAAVDLQVLLMYRPARESGSPEVPTSTVPV